MPTPFFNEEFTFTNPDGSTIQVRGWGNQYYAVFETLDGYTVVQDPDTGFYKYAQLSDDKNELLPTDAKVGEVDPQSLGLQPHIRIQRESAKQKAQTASMRQEAPSRWQVRRQQKKTQLRGIMPTTAAEALPLSTVTVGNYVGLCILIQFPDVPSTISQQEVSNFCNLPGYNGFGNNGSVRDYFYDNSRSKLTYTNVVTQYYTTAHNRSYYTDPAISYGTRARELIVEALNSLKSQGFNFSQLSSDSNGYVYALNVFYVGQRVNNWAEGLWPHSWSLASPYDVGGGKKLYDYQITNIGSELTLGTFCHENGHMICNFPDLYDYGYESYGVGNYCLMCFGGDDKNPVQVCAYLKNEAGWATKVMPITPGITASLSAANNDFYVYAKNATEYFIIENRQKTGRDTSLPNAGLAIWHVDEQGSNNNEQMTPSQHYECSLEQADKRFDLEKRVNAGDSTDLFRAPYKTEFSDSTSPSSKWWDGSNSGLKIAQISASGSTMTFLSGDFSGDGRTDVLFYCAGDGNWWLGRSDGQHLNWGSAGNTAGFGNLTRNEIRFFTGDFSGDGRTDVLFYCAGDGNWWLGRSDGQHLNWGSAGNTAGFGDLTRNEIRFFSGDFSGDGHMKLAGNAAQGFPAPQPIEPLTMRT